MGHFVLVGRLKKVEVGDLFSVTDTSLLLFLKAAIVGTPSIYSGNLKVIEEWLCFSPKLKRPHCLN